MNGAQARLRQGDLSSLSYILDAVEEAGMQAGELASPVSTDLIQLIIDVLLKEGIRLAGATMPAPPVATGYTVIFTIAPNEAAVTAMRILLSVGALQGSRGSLVRQELAKLSTRECRRLTLDAYFQMDPSKRYYAVNFANLLKTVKHCELRHIILNETNIVLAEAGIVQPIARAPPRDPAHGTRSSPTPGPVLPRFRAVQRVYPSGVPASAAARVPEAVPVESAADEAHTLPPPTLPAATAPNRPAPAERSPPRTTRRSSPTPPIGGAHSAPARSSGSGRTVPVFSSTHISIPSLSPGRTTPSPLPATSLTLSTEVSLNGGTSGRHQGQPGSQTRIEIENIPLPINGASNEALQHGTGNPNRRYRPLPRTASSTPFAQNPLYDATAPLSENVLLAAQFPTPVVLFSRLHGLGCMPRLPTAKQYQECQRTFPTPLAAARANTNPLGGSGGGGDGSGRGWADNEVLTPLLSVPQLSATATPRTPVWQSANTPPSAAASTTSTDDTARRQRIASNDRRTSMHAAANDPDYYIFPCDQSDAARAYHRVCRDHWLLSRYFDDGVMMSWGCMIHGAVGICPANDSTNAADGTPRKFFREDELKMATPAVYFQFSPRAANRLDRVIQAFCGTQTTLALTASGALYASGRCDCGQTGIGNRGERFRTTGCRQFRAVPVRQGERVVRAATGPLFGAAMTDSGVVYLWGHNSYGQCMRQPCAAPMRAPIRFRTGKIGVCDIACGLTFGALVFADGAMGSWGDARLLGHEAPTSTLSPTFTRSDDLCQPHLNQLNLPAGRVAVMVAAGPWHAAVVTKLGQLLTWGSGGSGRLGHNTTNDEVTPRLVEALEPVFVVSVACGAEHTAAMTSAGEVYVFGDNARGQLGVRGRRPRSSPAQLLLPAPALAVSCGAQQTCVLLQSGDVMACGALRATGCGLGRGAGGGALVRILHNHVTLAISCGTAHTAALTLPRTTALCRLGHSSVEELSRMESVLVRHSVRAVASGQGFLHLVSESGQLLALGRGERGQTGLGDAMKPMTAGEVTVVSSFQRVELPGEGTGRLEWVGAGPDYALALDGAGNVYGWGGNAFAQLGTDPIRSPCVYVPMKLACYTGRVITQLACGGTFVVALTEDAEVLTHGERAYCGLGGATTEDDPLAETPSGRARSGSAAAGLAPYVTTPTEINSLRGVTAIAAGLHHAAALTVSGLVYVWGKGALGTAPGVASVTAYVPTKVLLSCNVRQLGCGPRNTFVVSDEGELYVWGCNKHRQCGTRSDPPAAGAATTASPPGSAVSGGVVATPTRVLKTVRDAAFAARFSVVALESGEVRVAGRLRHQGADLHLTSHHADPQPTLSVTLNHTASSPSAKQAAKAAPPATVSPLRDLAQDDTDTEHTMIAAPDSFHASAELAPASAGDGSPDRRPPRPPRGRRDRRDSWYDTPFTDDADFVLNEFDSTPMTLASTITGSPHSVAFTAAPAPVLSLATAASSHRSSRDSTGEADETPSVWTTTTGHTARTAAPAGLSHARRTSLLIRRGPADALGGPTGEDGVSSMTSLPLPSAAGPTGGSSSSLPPRPPAAAAAPTGSVAVTLASPSRHGTAQASAPPPPSPLHALRVFGGWEQIFVVVEKDRPSAKDVQRAHRGLQVYVPATP